jgi:hypothetical protein
MTFDLRGGLSFHAEEDSAGAPVIIPGVFVLVGSITYHDNFESYPDGYPLDDVVAPNEWVARENYTGLKASDNHGTTDLGGIAFLNDSNTGTGWTDSYVARENATGHVYRDSFQLYADASDLNSQGVNGEVDWTASGWVARSL